MAPPLCLEGQDDGGAGNALRVAELAIDPAGLPAERQRGVEIALDVGEHGGAVERACAQTGRCCCSGQGQHLRERLATLGEMIALLPESEQRRAQPECPLGIAAANQPMAGGAEVVVLDVAASQPRFAVRRGHLEVFFLGDDEHVRRMCPRRGIGLARGEQLLTAVLAERFEHHEAQLAFLRGPLHEQAVVHERRDAVQHVDTKIFERIADSLGGFERAAAGEDRQTAEELLLGRRRAGRSST